MRLPHLSRFSKGGHLRPRHYIHYPSNPTLGSSGALWIPAEYHHRRHPERSRSSGEARDLPPNRPIALPEVHHYRRVIWVPGSSGSRCDVAPGFCASPGLRPGLREQRAAAAQHQFRPQIKMAQCPYSGPRHQFLSLYLEYQFEEGKPEFSQTLYSAQSQ